MKVPVRRHMNQALQLAFAKICKRDVVPETGEGRANHINDLLVCQVGQRSFVKKHKGW